MNLSINLNKQVLENEIIKIPFRFRQPEDTSFKISVDAHEISVVKVPVDCYSGDIIITEKHIDSLYIPEILTTAENGYANIEAHNPTDKRITLTFKGPLTAIPHSRILLKKILISFILNSSYLKSQKYSNRVI